jgi:hypothetical protein
MHPAVPLVAAFGGLSLLLVGVGVLWWIGDSQRRQADAADESNHLHARDVALVERGAWPDVHEAETRELPAARDGRG